MLDIPWGNNIPSPILLTQMQLNTPHPCSSRDIPTETCLLQPNCHLLSKQPAHPLQNTILFGIIWVIFRRNFEQGWKGRSVRFDAVSYLLGDMLIDEENSNVLALSREAIERRLDGRIISLVVYNEEIFLRIRRLRNMLYAASAR